MAPAVVQFEWMPEAFEETGAEVLTELAQRRRQPSHHRNIFPLKEAYRPNHKQQLNSLRLLSQTNPVAPSSKYVSTGDSPTELALLMRAAARSPGPGAYNPRLDCVAERARSVKLSRSKSKPPRLSASLKRVPGPGAYEVSDDLKRGTRFGHSVRSNSSRSATARNPGPGAYNAVSAAPPGGRLGPPRSPCDPLSRRLSGADEGVAPGPGHYDTHRPSTAGGRIASSSGESLEVISRRLRRDEPGPGHYDPCFEQTLSSVGVTIGKSSPPTDLEVQIQRAAQEPGPGEYCGIFQRPGTPTGVRYEARKGRASEADRSPGPGDYEPAAYSRDGSGVFAQSTAVDSYMALAERRSRGSPGPGAYNVGAYAFVQPGGILAEPGRSFSKAQRVDVSERQTRRGGVPGPGAYDLQEQRSTANPLAWLGSTLARAVPVSDTPGPGEYDLTRRARSPTAFLGSTGDRRATLTSASDNPGPGAYSITDPRARQRSASITGLMGSTVAKGDPSFELALKRAASTPGPLDYDIGSTLWTSGGRFARSTELRRAKTAPTQLLSRSASANSMASSRPTSPVKT